MKWTLEWNGEKVPVVNIEQLDGLLDSLQEQGLTAPFVVHLNSPAGATLNIGIGGEMSVLDYIAENASAAFAVVGNEAARGTVQFRVGDEISEYLARFSVPIEQAREAARYFYESLEMTPSLVWEED